MGKNMDVKKHEIRMVGREEVKDKAGRELWHLNVVSEIWASTMIIILNQQLRPF